MAELNVYHFHVDVVLWAIARRSAITADDIRTRWNVGRSTAFRWVQGLNEARKRAEAART